MKKDTLTELHLVYSDQAKKESCEVAKGHPNWEMVRKL